MDPFFPAAVAAAEGAFSNYIYPQTLQLYERIGQGAIFFKKWKLRQFDDWVKQLHFFPN